MTRKSTQKFEVVSYKGLVIVLSGISRTSAEQTRRMMGTKKEFFIRPVKGR